MFGYADSILNKSSDCSQREERHKWHQTKMKSKSETIKQAKSSLALITKRKSEGDCPKPPKKDRSQESSSHVWKFFKEITVEGIPYNECTICKNKLKYCESSTTNMAKHIRTKHPAEHDKIKDTDAGNPQMTSFVTKPAQWKRDAKNTVEWERKIVQFVVATNQPLSVVENPYFRALLPKEFIQPVGKLSQMFVLRHALKKPKRDYSLT